MEGAWFPESHMQENCLWITDIYFELSWARDKLYILCHWDFKPAAVFQFSYCYFN